jgi:hypothetical protein
MFYVKLYRPVHIGSVGEWFEILTNVVAVSVAACDLIVNFKNHFGVRVSTENSEVLPMNENRNSLLASNLNKIKEFVLKSVNSFYFRATLFLLGVGVFLPLPMCIGLLPCNNPANKTTNKYIKFALFVRPTLASLRGLCGR